MLLNKEGKSPKVALIFCHTAIGLTKRNNRNLFWDFSCVFLEISFKWHQQRAFQISQRFKLLGPFFLCVILNLCAEFQVPTMPATGQKVCGGGGVVF